MAKILVYGDSYGSICNDPPANDWPARLAKKMNLHVENHAIAGSSTDYAVSCLVRDHLNSHIEDGDIVIFIKSTPGRLALNFQKERPETAAPYLHDISKTQPDYKDSMHDWYRENRKNLEWLVLNTDYQRECIIHESYTHLVQSISAYYKNSFFVVYSNYIVEPNIPNPNTPVNYLEPKHVSLFDISEEEVITEVEKPGRYKEWVKYSIFDMRDNHLSQPNLQVLADLTLEMIEAKSTRTFDINKFHKNLYAPIKTADEYMSYVDQGFLPYSQWRHEACEKISTFKFFK